jgi:PAS domain S-box-containing protein
MKDRDKTKDQLIRELDYLRRRNAELEAREAEHQQTAGALVQSEMKFRKLTEKSVVGVYLVQDELFTYVNPKMAQIFGYEPNEMANRIGPKDIIFHEDWPRVEENLRKRFSGEVEALNFRFKGITKNRDIIHAEVYGTRTQDHGGPAIIGTLMDITEGVRATENLESELKKFQALYDLAVAMTAARTLDENLQLLVENSRSLLKADKAFLALRDVEQDDLYMHILSGIETEGFKALRIPFGVGMGGMVAETGRLCVVEDYFKEIEPAFHDAIGAEGLISGIAVPVQIGTTNLGVLYVFNRTQKPFSQSDLDTLSLLGNLAAVEITRRRAQEQLAEREQSYRVLYDEARGREELYRSLLHSSADAIVIYDMEGYTQYVSPSFTTIFGWTLDDVKGKRIPFLPESEREASLSRIEEILRDGTTCAGFESKRFTKDHRVVDVSISASRYHDHNGNPAGLLGILRDITERKRAEAKLRESEERYKDLYAESERRRQLYRTLLDVSPDPIIVYDMAGIPTYSNPAFTRVFGWTFDELKGKRTDFVPEENWPETREMINMVLQGKNFSGTETRRYTRDRRILDVSISGATFFDKAGDPSGSVVHLRDITPRKQAEANLAAELKKFQVLYELALAMSAERTLDDNLVLIVEKSRDLLAADKSFIALRDEQAGDLYMHTLSGIVTEEFKSLRIPLGVGLGGKVAQTGQLNVVEDYFKEIGPIFHDIARAEGLFSGIAVPVQIGRTNVGVLYVFNRTKKPFSKSDVDTLSLLGNLAAVEITRKRSQERLREREDSYRQLYEEAKKGEELYVSLLNSSADAIVIYDMEGNARYVSPSFTRIFGWTMEEVVGKRIPFLPDSEREPTMRIITGLIEHGIPCMGFETKRYTKEGNILDISISSSRYRDHQGNPAGILVILRDITDRKRAEAALKESEERFRTVAELAPFGMVLLAPDETTEYINPKYTEIFGFTLEDVMDSKSWFDMAYPNEESRDKAAAIWREETAEIRSEYGIGIEASPRIFTVKCKDGQFKKIAFRAVVLANGRIIATFLDVTTEVDAQEKIIRAKNEWERTFNSVSDLIIILDGQQEIVRANKALADRLNVAPDQLIGMNCRDVSISEKSAAALCPDTSVLADGMEHSVEVVDESIGGVFDLRVSPLRDEEGRLLGSVNVARDITAFKAIERARRLAVHHLSHELKTPLAIIKGSVKDLADEQTSVKLKERKIERIKRSLGRLTDIQLIVQEIVAPSQYQPTNFSVVSTLEEIVDDIRKKAAHRLVALTTQLEPLETNIIDPKVFSQALRTLVKNAIENTPDEGEVVISLKSTPTGVLLQVADNGVGISPSDREFVFEAFHHTQDTEHYATKNPFDFNAGGKGLELMRLKILSENGSFDISFESDRCRYLRKDLPNCPGVISECGPAGDATGCKESGGTTFSVLFKGKSEQP